ncbi:hypothetical protein [Parvularcula dongshanensis]|uniref:Small-conductance mechanosensitive channel n=1 Tax=Parvularcula dongshanensis TaxID=1173995 RepID=A0A840I0L4_9PROT|nr:hypothetical protein [Parvularcula dongshanensis]MBB4657728.1 small-conductance mechanosensitive channel [Parvularcula dongshanensis]
MRPGVWFWIVGAFALFWNGFGLFDLVMTVSDDEAYLSSYTPEQIAYWDALPWWRLTLWVVGVCTALLASILLLLRRSAAVPLFMVAPVAMVIGLLHDAVTGGFAVYGASGVVMSIVILAIAIFFVWYADRQRRRGVLRSGARAGTPVAPAT